MFKRIINFFKPVSMFEPVNKRDDAWAMREFFHGIVVRGMNLKPLFEDGVVGDGGNIALDGQVYSPYGRPLGPSLDIAKLDAFKRRALKTIEELKMVPMESHTGGDPVSAREEFISGLSHEVIVAEAARRLLVESEAAAMEQEQLDIRNSPVSVEELMNTMEVKVGTGVRHLLGNQYRDLREPLLQVLTVWFAYQQSIGDETLPYHKWGKRTMERFEEEFSNDDVFNPVYILDGEHATTLTGFARSFDTPQHPNRVVEMYYMVREAICASRVPAVMQVLARNAEALENVNRLLLAHDIYYAPLPKVVHLNKPVVTPYGALGITDSPRFVPSEWIALRNLQGLYKLLVTGMYYSEPKKTSVVPAGKTLLNPDCYYIIATDVELSDDDLLPWRKIRDRLRTSPMPAVQRALDVYAPYTAKWDDECEPGEVKDA